jgi:hypothetical protein
VSGLTVREFKAFTDLAFPCFAHCDHKERDDLEEEAAFWGSRARGINPLAFGGAVDAG